MLTPILASFLAAGALGHGPSEPASFPSLSAELATASAPAPRPQQEDYLYGLAPAGWASFNVAFFSTEIDQDTVGDPDDDTGLGGELGIYGWQGEMGLGLEIGLIHSTYEAQIDALASEDVDVWRGTLGVRLADRGSGERFLPWLRAGFLYRFDDGDSFQDDGPGFYIGGGFDFVLIGGLALSPQLVYQKSRSVDSEEWIGILSATYLF